MKNSKAARVVFPTGEVRQFREPVKAAEINVGLSKLLLSKLAFSYTLAGGFPPLEADEELESGNAYLMFPMKRVSTVCYFLPLIRLSSSSLLTQRLREFL
ncbi:hypothetical protein NC653_026666 [Populus alba x Populus x berolinensis]|uniref:Uncharacterized protein n=1 Tax=Populus alba x Populus x berolinensis TaxID=444605 RepID=A0AAD6MFL5_9ROSI|nr:hypothetical protein NC653_026666 [Populus alba x Populus x berolinensis]